LKQDSTSLTVKEGFSLCSSF